jgi:multicomponent Na+:H+ antiporter subunit G
MAGSFFCLVGGLGLVRLPDFYTRVHAGGVTDTLGAGLVILGLTFQAGFSLITVKLLLILGFLWLTSATTAHAAVKAAMARGLKAMLHDDRGDRDDPVAPEQESEPSSS